MALFMISGKVSEDCVIKIIQDEEFMAEQAVVAGPYVLYFESNSLDSVTAVAENKDGILISFGHIKPIEVIQANVLSKEHK